MSYKQKELTNGLILKFDESNNEAKVLNEMVQTKSLMHEFSAQIVDFLNIGTRVITSIINNIKEDESLNNKFLTFTQIEELFSYHSMYEFAQYLIDKVAYDELRVINVDFDRHKCNLEYSDYNLVKTRYIQIRDNISFKLINKNSLLKEMFEEFAVEYMIDYMKICKIEMGYRFENKDKLITSLKRRMDEFGEDDDLILMYLDDNDHIKATYLFAIILLSISIVNDNILYTNEPSVNNKEFYHIPLELISQYVEEQFDLKLDEKIINYFCIRDKIKNSKDLYKKPFLITNEGVCFGMLSYTNAFYWIENIRNNFINGDEISNLIGNKREVIIESIFKEHYWNILGRGMELKENGQTITDIDLLVEKNGLILLIQSKGIGACTTSYDIWKAKKTIEDGISQANTSIEFIKKNKNFIPNILEKNKIESNKSIIVQPLVVTPNSKFSGWNSNGVPVLSTSNLLDIIIQTQDSRNKKEVVVKIEKFLKSNSELTVSQIKYEKINLCGFDFKIPDIDFNA